MKERLSALIDGEHEPSTLGDDLGQLKSDQGLRSTCDIYLLIGDALRGHVAPGYAEKVSERLSREPTVLAPRSRPGRTGRLAWFALSAAASIAGVVFIAWMALPMMRPGPQLAAAKLPSESVPHSAPPAAVGVENYLLAHQRFSPTSEIQGVAPYVRMVSEEAPGGGRGQ